MRNLPIVLVPVALAAVLLALFLMAKSRPDTPAGVDPAVSRRPVVTASDGPSEATRLRNDLEALRKDVEAQKARAEKAEAELARIKEAASHDPDPWAKSAAGKGDWRTRHDAEFENQVKSMPWRKHVKSLVEYWKEVERGRAEGRGPRLDPDLIEGLTKLQADSIALAKLLGIAEGDPYKAYQNEVVSRSWHDSFLQELSGGTLTEDQLAKLRATKIYAIEPDFDVASGGLFESWKHLVEANRAYLTDTQGILTADQYALVGKSVTPTFMMSVYAMYSEKTIASIGADTSKAVAQYWMESFKLPADQATTVEAVAAELVRQQAALAQSQPATPSKDAEFELLLKSIDLQMSAEKKLAETLSLDPETAKKLLKGSGALIKITGW